MAEGGDSVDSGRKSRSWRDEIPEMTSLYLGSEEVEPVLCREHGQEFKHFCKAHMTELCIMCRRMEHRTCKPVMDIEDAADDIYSEMHGVKIIQSVKNLIDRFKDCKAAAEDLKSKVPEKEKLALDKLKQARKDINDYLDELEANAVAEIDRNIKEYINAIEEKIRFCKASLSSLNAFTSDIDRTISVGNKEEKFVAINRATKQTKQYYNMLLDMYGEMSDIDVKFDPNLVLPDIFQSLGTVSVETTKVTDVFIDTTPIYTGELKLKYVPDDSEVPLVTSLEVLADGRKLVLDDDNGRMHLYDKRNTFVTSIVLPIQDGDRCMSFVLTSNTEALVSVCNQRLFKVVIGDELAVSEIKTNYPIFLMTKCGEEFLCLLYHNDQVNLCVMNKNMEKIIKTILKDVGTLFSAPKFLGVSADKNTVYVLDCYKGCYGMSLDGQIRFHYQNPEAKGYGGLVVDSDGLFIGSEVGIGFQVEKLNFSGEREEVCIFFGKSMPLKVVENELALFHVDVSSGRCVIFYCLLKTM